MKTNKNQESNKYLRAKKRVDEIKGFYLSLVAYFVVIPFLVFINYRTSWNYQWFWWPAFGWGIGIIIQAFITFGYGRDWEEKMIREYMEKDNK